jgi:hypothetical protein
VGRNPSIVGSSRKKFIDKLLERWGGLGCRWDLSRGALSLRVWSPLVSDSLCEEDFPAIATTNPQGRK